MDFAQLDFHLGVIGGSGGVIGGSSGVIAGSGVVGSCLGVDRDTLVGHIGDITVIVVGGVLNVLGSSVREGNRVAAGNGTVDIGGLGGGELGLGIVIGNTVLKSVGGGLLFVVGRMRSGVGVGGGGVGNYGGSVVHNRGVVRSGRSMVHNRGMVRGSGGVVRGRGVVGGGSGSMVDRGSMVDWGCVVGGSSMVDRGCVIGGGSVVNHRGVVRARGMVGS